MNWHIVIQVYLVIGFTISLFGVCLLPVMLFDGLGDSRKIWVAWSVCLFWLPLFIGGLW